MNAWSLPQSALIGDVEYPINSDFRDILEIIRYLNDETKTVYLRWKIALALFFDGEIPDKYEEEAAQYLSDFISCGKKDEKIGPKLIDWEQDALLIVTDINKVAGKEIRAEKYLHWWTFLGWFHSIGEGNLSTLVSIRDKLRRGKKLESHEQEYYRRNKSRVNLRKKYSASELAEQERLQKLLG